MDDCIFCKIVNGEIPASKIYEDDDVLAFLDISQTTPGHSLLIPKKHVRNVLEMDADTASQTFYHLPKLARALQSATNAIGMNIVNNNEEIAGQTVFHAHIHLVPRYSETDGIVIQYTTHEPDFDRLAQLANKIKMEVGE
ncbi:histidine triad protein [Streptococcus bovimastitidis]|uniref:Histidine triad protein n=1 Tax=Streptococcus bovimastitidis TaxID=1856638 RepID=A0A1L8MME7_9STRE|nr:HIT family protein [Streptococcus bovimastitidis]OJF71950.1 histidine triad protein [Streptococcus bovimastitidis]